MTGAPAAVNGGGRGGWSEEATAAHGRSLVRLFDDNGCCGHQICLAWGVPTIQSVLYSDRVPEAAHTDAVSPDSVPISEIGGLLMDSTRILLLSGGQ